MAEAQAVEETVLNAFMADLEPENQPANPAGEAPVVEGADAPTQPEPEEVVAQKETQDEQTIEIDPDEPLFDLEVTDEEGKKTAQKVSLREFQQGYLRERDYRKKTQELARQREELPKLVAKQGQELSESYTKRLAELQGLVVKTVAAELADKDLNKLAAEDPFAYVQISNRARQLNELLQAVQKEQAAEFSKKQELEQKSSMEKWQRSLEILQSDIPDFGPSVVKRLIDVGEEWGFSKDEVSGWTDHRLIKMLHALSDKKTVESKKPEIEKKVAVVTKVMKPGQPTKARSSLDDAKARFKKGGGKVGSEDGIALFEAMLN
jgi:hypothetical protein